MKIKMPKVNVGKIAAYGGGGLIGAGLTWLGWRWLEGKGINPLQMFKKHAEEGHRIYFDPSQVDEEFDMENIGKMTIDENEEVEEVPEEDDDEDDEPPEERYTQVNNRPVQIDADTFDHSQEEEDMQHAYLRYFKDDESVVDDNDELVQEPWKILGLDNYDDLHDPEGESVIYIRNEAAKIDYAISKEEGCWKR